MAPVPAEPVLGQEETAALLAGIRQFNEGFYFECHDTLEELWGGLRGASRDFFQGLIQVAVAHYHIGNGNLAGAESMFLRALKRLEAYPVRYCGFDVGAERGEIEARLAWVRSGAAGDPGSAPRWRFELLGMDA